MSGSGMPLDAEQQAFVEMAEERLAELMEKLATAEQRCHLILATIYDGHSYRDLDVEGQQAAKLRHIERLARLDWDDEGMSRVV